ncbi:hypothetical protein [Rummeliibacillus sp. POC4]|uniref:hypothetical protein n=1 Tax=Rummeliibacillus sp. POC4 TaxID=2305899 RepID=UPI000E669299|nr:hypothetical protein [Rummeliibacillus sp. POC4]RIJ63613.1 hypothetical protein D1606_14125 [Rummeliibacillus sp. POC4]
MNKIIICGEMAENKKDIFQLFGGIGEMNAEDIPVAPNVNIDELKKGDDDPLEVVVEIPASKSKRGWNYTSNSLKDIVNHVNSQTLNGFLGHQRPEDVSNQFLPPVTHWVGAKMAGETAYFRGVVDAAAKDLKRWIKSGRVKQVSIFGMPKIQKVAGETNVVGYKPLSIDWTPLDRAGMNTRIVAMSGEMWDLDGDGPEGEMKKGGVNVNPEELLVALKTMLNNKQLTVPMIAGEMGWKPDEVAGDIDAKWLTNMTASVDKLKKVEEALGVSGEMDVVKVAQDAAEAIKKQSTIEFDKVVGEMMEKKIASEAIRKDMLDDKTVIGKIWSYQTKNFDTSITEEQLAGEMDTFLADQVVKDIISNYHTDKPAGVSVSNNNKQAPKGLKPKRTAL